MAPVWEICWLLDLQLKITMKIWVSVFWSIDPGVSWMANVVLWFKCDPQPSKEIRRLQCACSMQCLPSLIQGLLVYLSPGFLLWSKVGFLLFWLIWCLKQMRYPILPIQQARSKQTGWWQIWRKEVLPLSHTPLIILLFCWWKSRTDCCGLRVYYRKLNVNIVPLITAVLFCRTGNSNSESILLMEDNSNCRRLPWSPEKVREAGTAVQEELCDLEDQIPPGGRQGQTGPDGPKTS